MRHTEWLESYEELIVLCVVIGSLLYSILFAQWLSIWFLSSKSQSDKNFFAIIITIFWIITLSYWFMPREIMLDEITSINGCFVGGPYPDKKHLNLLKAEGYTAVISLLDPIVLPAEPWLYVQEKYNAQKIGIKLINIPMIPGNIYRVQSIKSIEELAKNACVKDKYYVHGYYSQDRVKTFIEIVNINSK